jgi:hypothetical protein
MLACHSSIRPSLCCLACGDVLGPRRPPVLPRRYRLSRRQQQRPAAAAAVDDNTRTDASQRTVDRRGPTYRLHLLPAVLLLAVRDVVQQRAERATRLAAAGSSGRPAQPERLLLHQHIVQPAARGIRIGRAAASCRERCAIIRRVSVYTHLNELRERWTVQSKLRSSIEWSLDSSSLLSLCHLFSHLSRCRGGRRRLRSVPTRLPLGQMQGRDPGSPDRPTKAPRG